MWVCRVFEIISQHSSIGEDVFSVMTSFPHTRLPITLSLFPCHSPEGDGCRVRHLCSPTSDRQGLEEAVLGVRDGVVPLTK